MSKARQTIAVVPVERLTAHPANIRDDLGDLTEMAASIREHGILQPLTATEHPTLDGRLILLAGHRRLSASVMAGIHEVPVIIRHDITDQAEHLVIMLVENTQRRDLHPVERAQAYQALVNQGLTKSEVARRTGSAASTVTYYLSLLDLDDEDLEDVREGRVNSTTAIAAVRTIRRASRVAQNQPERGRPVAAWFSSTHRLAAQVKAACTHHARRKVGTVGCGPCWETAIRADGGGPVPLEDQDVHEVDEVLVQRILEGQWREPCNPAEKVAVAAAFVKRGGSLRDLGDLTGWRAERYGSNPAMDSRRRSEDVHGATA